MHKIIHELGFIMKESNKFKKNVEYYGIHGKVLKEKFKKLWKKSNQFEQLDLPCLVSKDYLKNNPNNIFPHKFNYFKIKEESDNGSKSSHINFDELYIDKIFDNECIPILTKEVKVANLIKGLNVEYVELNNSPFYLDKHKLICLFLKNHDSYTRFLDKFKSLYYNEIIDLKAPILFSDLNWQKKVLDRNENLDFEDLKYGYLRPDLLTGMLINKNLYYENFKDRLSSLDSRTFLNTKDGVIELDTMQAIKPINNTEDVKLEIKEKFEWWSSEILTFRKDLITINEYSNNDFINEISIGFKDNNGEFLPFEFMTYYKKLNIIHNSINIKNMCKNLLILEILKKNSLKLKPYECVILINNDDHQSFKEADDMAFHLLRRNISAIFLGLNTEKIDLFITCYSSIIITYESKLLKNNQVIASNLSMNIKENIEKDIESIYNFVIKQRNAMYN